MHFSRVCPISPKVFNPSQHNFQKIANWGWTKLLQQPDLISLLISHGVNECKNFTFYINLKVVIFALDTLPPFLVIQLFCKKSVSQTTGGLAI